MQRVALCSMLLLAAAQQVHAAAVTHIANGDCAGLQRAASSPAGQEPALIVLAAKGTYDCSFAVAGKIAIDGAGADFYISALGGFLSGPNRINVATGASLLLRNINLGVAPVTTAAMKAPTKGPPPKPTFPVIFSAPIVNSGNLTLDSASLSGGVVYYSGPSVIGFSALIENSGVLSLRNVSMTGNIGPLIDNSGSVDIAQSTLADNQSSDATTYPILIGTGSLRIANSILSNGRETNCAGRATASLGGNITSDTTCGLNSTNDHVVADAKLGAFDTHGGVVSSVALNYDSPAIGNGLAANCEAADARGAARGQTSCDSGAYEFGGGQGKIGVSGTSGLYFDHEHNGHYVTVQRVFDDNVLVIWNTFDEQGKQAWLNGVGKVNGGHIHVDQVAQNLGGTLQPGGLVNGATPTFWGTFDLDVSSCYTATLNYHSVLPHFGDGSVNLDRLAFINGLDCSP